jgi:hypothetical protein
VEANSTGDQGSRRAVALSDDVWSSRGRRVAPSVLLWALGGHEWSILFFV